MPYITDNEGTTYDVTRLRLAYFDYTDPHFVLVKKEERKHKSLSRTAIPSQSDDVRVQQNLDGLYDIIDSNNQFVNNTRLKKIELVELGFTID